MSEQIEQAARIESPLAALAALTVPDSAAQSRRAEFSLRSAQDMVIADADDYQLACDELGEINDRMKRLDEQRKSITDPLRKAADAVMQLFRAPAETLALAKAELSGKMLAWNQEQRRIAEEAAAKVRAEQEAERKRNAEAAAQLKAEADALAEKARETGDCAAEDAAMEATAAAAQAAQSANMVTRVAAVSAPAAAKGAAVRSVVDFEVINLLALVQHVAKNPGLINLLAANPVPLRAQVKATGENTQLPGVRIFRKESIAATGKR